MSRRQTRPRLVSFSATLIGLTWVLGCTPDESAREALPAADARVLDAVASPDMLEEMGVRDAAMDGRDAATPDLGGDAAPVDAGAPADATPPRECDTPARLDDACTPGSNCCSDGLVCVDFGGGGRCVAECDAREPACGPQALCVPLALPAPERPIPGACLQSARCDVDARAACGPSTTCTVLANITLCTRAGDVPVGGACTVFDEAPALCESGSTCFLGQCQASCSGGCPDDTRCVDLSAQLDGAPFAVCLGGCDVFSQSGCAADETCVIGTVAPTLGSGLRQVVGTCIARPHGVGVQNQPCAPIAGTDWGDCRGGHLCQRHARDAEPVCLGICDAVDRSLCVNGSLCMDDVDGFDPGLCVGDCVVWPGPGDKRCAEDEICQFEHIGRTVDGAIAPGGTCRPGAGLHGSGEPCVVDPETGDHSCAQGHLCTPLEPDAPPVCVKLCERMAEGPHGCGPDEGCVDAFGDARIGVCLPGFRK